MTNSTIRLRQTNLLMKIAVLLLAAALSFAFAVFLSPSANAASSSSTQTAVTNHVGMGNVHIQLDEYSLDKNGNEVPFIQNQTVVPGQKVDKIVRITNEANDAWIRVKVDFYSEDGLTGLDESMLVMADGDWVHIGDYWYYKKPLKSKESVDFIKKVVIPSSWGNEAAGKNFSIVVRADAVQEKNFTPDFNSNDPWFGTIIEESVTDSTSGIVPTNQDFSVAYEGGAEGLVRVGDDFFSNWGELMPGDTVSDKVIVRNDYSSPVAIYFRTETIADDDLLKALHLVIRNGNQVLYDGSLSGAIQSNVLLGILNPGQQVELTYTLTVPKELTNRYALSKTQTRWVFLAEVETPDPDPEDPPRRRRVPTTKTQPGTTRRILTTTGPNGSTPPQTTVTNQQTYSNGQPAINMGNPAPGTFLDKSTATPTSTGQKIYQDVTRRLSNVSTGATLFIYLLALIGAASIITGIILLIKKKGGKENEQE